ncbi:protein phosphatase 1 regulatory subunit 3C-B-like [Astyanax mexicanus]|uniref:protein phosphatase 1 regulatory subunit 3C-B-like n=1 Tax=Astyanax mexicanus TaxID=7994 RepID=UPI0020CB1026|nr:protein phosphatase 1 regulatory subunit 3C-B-like [Astyanax mexicanus]
MLCAKVLSISMNMGFGLPTHHHLLTLPPAKAKRRSCTKKRVVFADTKGLSLTSVRVFSKKEEKVHYEAPPCRIPTRLCWLGEHAQVPRLHLGFTQPCSDPQAFRQRMDQCPVLLENCCISEQALVGMVRVWNVSYEKAVHVRITFDSWRSQQDVPCSFLERRCGDPDTDTFSFHITLPETLETQERIEFCVRYLPQGYSQAVWDNNYGKNYSLRVCD